MTPPPQLCCTVLAVRENPFAIGGVLWLVAPPGALPMLPLTTATRMLYLICAALILRHLYIAAQQTHATALGIATQSAYTGGKQPSQATTAVERLLLILPPEAKVQARAKLGLEASKGFASMQRATADTVKGSAAGIAGRVLGSGVGSGLGRVPTGPLTAAAGRLGNSVLRWVVGRAAGQGVGGDG